MDQALRNAVWERAQWRCEYCRMPQRAVDATFHIEHIVARQHPGSDEESNLALACDRCNLFKGPNLSSVDQQTGEVVLLFHPRRDCWVDHFELRGDMICGLTAKGRVTASLLQMNARARRELRAYLLVLGTW